MPARPWTARATVRVLLVDPDDRLLLFQDSDAPVGARWWFLPGGGIDAGESELDAVVRELHEETGLVVDAAQVLGPLARRRVLHGYSDLIVDQHDTFYAVRAAAFEVSTAGHTEDELRTLVGYRWWTRAQLAQATAGQVWPVLLPQLWQLADEPRRWPVQLEDVEESSVAIGPADRPLDERPFDDRAGGD